LAEVVERFVDADATVEHVVCAVDLTRVHAAHRVITFAECAAHHADRYCRDPGRFGPRARELLDLGLLTPAHAYLHAEVVRRDATERLHELFSNLDVLIVPVTAGSAPPRDTTGDSRFQIPWTLCGFPTLALPTGDAAGLPLAAQLVTAPTNEATLLTVARWCEDVLDWNLTPPVGPMLT
jgi:aspartyl-tRNA(Asn)/glutamyl-tRNA(Gln) amidotransferase subunit A